jgi:hypothetical protein
MQDFPRVTGPSVHAIEGDGAGITGLGENGRRLFTSPVHPAATAHAVAVGGRLVLVGG